jgi:uncharacterized phiE125 gp8 family phage protein
VIHHSLGLTDTLISTVANASPPVQALTLSYVQDHIRALGQTDANLIAVWIDAAAMYFESQTGRQLLTATREAWIDAFPFLGASGLEARIELPHPPLQSVVSVKYIDGNGVLQSFVGGSPLANLFRTSAPAGPTAARGYVEPLFGQAWPVARDETGAVRIQYTCGYGNTAAAIPALVRQLLCYLVGHFDTFRSAVHEARRGQVLELPYGVQSLVDVFKYSALPSQQLRHHGQCWRPTPWL